MVVVAVAVAVVVIMPMRFVASVVAKHYYYSHDMINPHRIVPVGPDADWNEPHGRG